MHKFSRGRDYTRRFLRLTVFFRCYTRVIRDWWTMEEGKYIQDPERRLHYYSDSVPYNDDTVPSTFRFHQENPARACAQQRTHAGSLEFSAALHTRARAHTHTRGFDFFLSPCRMGVLMSGNPDPMASKLQLETVRSTTDSPPNWIALVRARERSKRSSAFSRLIFIEGDFSSTYLRVSSHKSSLVKVPDKFQARRY